MRSLKLGLAAGVMAAAFFVGTAARAQSPEELAAGRQLFVEALADQEQGRFAAALEKFRRVQRVRDTVPVRYRLGSALEGLGKIALAVDAYASAIRLGNSTNAEPEVVRAAQARVDALSPRHAHLTLRDPSGSLADAEVSVDGERVDPQALADLPVDPGTHVVTATAKGARPFRAPVTVSEGARLEVPITLEPVAPPPPPAPASDSSSSLRTIGIVTGAAGGALVVGGLVVLALRSSAISDLKQSCPNGNCPAEREQELRDTRDRAVLEGPVGVALLVAGAAAVGTGIVLFGMSGSGSRSARLVPSPSSNGAMLTFASGF
jgi:hypothetical protein